MHITDSEGNVTQFIGPNGAQSSGHFGPSFDDLGPTAQSILTGDYDNWASAVTIADDTVEHDAVDAQAALTILDGTNLPNTLESQQATLTVWAGEPPQDTSVTYLEGVAGQAYYGGPSSFNNGQGDAAGLSGMSGYTQWNGSGTCHWMQSLYADGSYNNVGSGGTVTNMAGLKIDDQTYQDGAVTNTYGLYIIDQVGSGGTFSPTNVWAIKTGKGLVEFGDNVKLDSGLTLAYKAITTAYTIGTADYQIEATSGTFDITLPTAVGIQGRVYSVKNSGTGSITLATTSAQTIDGATTKALAQYTNVRVMSNGTNWIVV
jgi:hypothetical protein